jgi:hypothetical protein
MRNVMQCNSFPGLNTRWDECQITSGSAESGPVVSVGFMCLAAAVRVVLFVDGECRLLGCDAL